jgi:putative SOS response-associated peptidase YedK
MRISTKNKAAMIKITDKHICVLDGKKRSNWLTSDVRKEHGVKFSV